MKNKKTYYEFEDIKESERGWLFYDTAIKAWKKINEYIHGPKVLDVGCGSGIMMGLIKVLNPELDIAGFEGDENGKSLWEQRKLNVKVGNIYQLPFKDNQMDTVYSSHVIEHLEDPVSALNEMKRVTKNRLITMVPDGNVDDKNYGTKHLHYFNRINITELHDQLGMRLIHCQSILDYHMNQIIVVYEK